MITVDRWTGEEALVLRSVMRLSVRDFANRLGINPRTVSRWKQLTTRECQPAMQQVLDAALGQCTPAEQEAFRVRVARLRGEVAAPPRVEFRPAPCTVVAHRFLPVYVGELPGMNPDGLAPGEVGPGGLDQHVAQGRHPSAQSTIHLFACGVAVLHLEERVRFESLTDLAVWRYRSYSKDRSYAGRSIRGLLGEPGEEVPNPEYALSVYEVREHSWSSQGLDTALQLLATPSVLVDRQDPDQAVPLPGVEDEKFHGGWVHPEAVEIGGGVSRGVVGWSGVAYHPRPGDRSLTMGEIVALELDVQALWALSSHVLHMIEAGEDPVMPETCGWRFLRGAHSRLTAARPTETAQHRTMREAILTTSELPDRLRAAQVALRDSTL